MSGKPAGNGNGNTPVVVVKSEFSDAILLDVHSRRCLGTRRESGVAGVIRGRDSKSAFANKDGSIPFSCDKPCGVLKLYNEANNAAGNTFVLNVPVTFLVRYLILKFSSQK